MERHHLDGDGREGNRPQERCDYLRFQERHRGQGRRIRYKVARSFVFWANRFCGLSFTISDQDLIEVLSFANTLKTETGIKVIVSSVNHKISVYDPQMKNTPGMAARVFSAIAASDADIRLITTSEVEISLLVTEADYDTVLEAIEEAVNAK